MNKIILYGRLGADPELKYGPTGTAMCGLRVATTERYKDKDGNQQEKTEWHRVVAFGKVGEVIGKHFVKGDPILLEGRNQTRKWQDKEGRDVYITEIMLSTFEFVGGKPKAAEAQSSQDQSTVTDQPFNDEIPF